MPADKRPALGSVGVISGLHLAVTHSGVTLAPVIAETLVREVMGEEQDELAAAYKASRFFTSAHLLRQRHIDTANMHHAYVRLSPNPGDIYY